MTNLVKQFQHISGTLKICPWPIHTGTEFHPQEIIPFP